MHARLIFGFLRRTFTYSLAVLAVSAFTQVSAQHYLQTNLVSDVPGRAAVTDPDLVNPWGLVASPTSPWWVANNGTGTSTLYTGAGVKVPLTVTIPTAVGGTPPSAPTGVVFNGNIETLMGRDSFSLPRTELFQPGAEELWPS